MSIVAFGILSGAAFAAPTLLIMLPMKWKSIREKFEAILAATLERFTIGFVVVNVQILPIAPLNGLAIGLVMSAPSAIITRAYVPVFIVGALGAALVGFVRTLVGL
jgi:hypothetical protein